jgi:DnaK suppressor protein
VTDVRRLLGDERERTRRRLADLVGSFDDLVTSAYDANVDDEHDPEGTTIAFERS